MIDVSGSLTVWTMSDDDNPEFGYGASGRPLWTVRDRDAEVIRTVLRKAGRREFSNGQGGFVVEASRAGRTARPSWSPAQTTPASRRRSWHGMRRRCARPATGSSRTPMTIRRCARGQSRDQARSPAGVEGGGSDGFGVRPLWGRSGPARIR